MAQAAEDLLVRIDATTEQLRRELRRADDAVAKSARSIDSRLEKVDRAFEGLNERVRGFAGAFGAAFAGIAVGAGFRSVMRASLAMERIENTLQAATGSAAAAGEELAFLRAESDRLGLAFEQAAGAYASFAAAAQGTALEGQQTREIFTAVAEATTVLGLSAEESEGALRALEQMISKGTVSAEELRGQLGERIPGAFQMAARAMGVTTTELDAMLRKGEVAASELLPRLAKELRATFGEQVQEAANGLQASINRLNNAVFELVQGEGSLPAATQGFNELAATFKDPQFQQSVDALTSALLTDFREIAELVDATVRGAQGLGRIAAEVVVDGPQVRLKKMRGQQAQLLEKLRFASEHSTEYLREIGFPVEKVAQWRAEVNRLSAEMTALQRMVEGADSYGGVSPPPPKPDPKRHAPIVDGGTVTGGGGAGRGVARGTAPNPLAEKTMLEQQRLRYLELDLIGRLKTQEEVREEIRQRALNAARGVNETLIQQNLNLEEQMAMLGAIEAPGKTVEEAAANIKGQMESLDMFAKEAAENMQDYFGEAFFDFMQGGFDDVLGGFTKMIDRMIAEALAAQLARKLFGGMVEGGEGDGLIGGVFGSIAKAMFGGGKAAGGNVAAGRLYEVNERGAEMLTVGNRDYLMMGNRGGRVTPNDQLGGGRAPIIHMTVNARDAGSFRQSQSQILTDLKRGLS